MNTCLLHQNSAPCMIDISPSIVVKSAFKPIQSKTLMYSTTCSLYTYVNSFGSKNTKLAIIWPVKNALTFKDCKVMLPWKLVGQNNTWKFTGINIRNFTRKKVKELWHLEALLNFFEIHQTHLIEKFKFKNTFFNIPFKVLLTYHLTLTFFLMVSSRIVNSDE